MKKLSCDYYGSFFGCKSEDGSDGKVYLTQDWTIDVTAFNGCMIK